MKLEKLTNNELLEHLRSLVAEERRLTTEVLRYLRELEIRKLYLDEGYPSLFEYCVKELSYSASAAFRRISAMRLLKSLPAPEVESLENKIVSGELNVTKLAKAQEFFKRQAEKEIILDPTAKVDILNQLNSKTVRECDRFFAGLDPSFIPDERMRVIDNVHTELRFVVDDEFLNKLEYFKSLVSNAGVDVTLSGTFNKLLEIGIEQIEKQKGMRQPRALPAPEVQRAASCKTKRMKNVARRYVAASDKRKLFERDRYRCTYKNPKTGRVCGSRYQIEIDHIQPVALDGTSNLENLRLLCRAHNLRRAEKTFGVFRKT